MVSTVATNGNTNQGGSHATDNTAKHDQVVPHYLNGHCGAWAPLHPQWQHWGELCAAADVGVWDAPECEETGREAESDVEHDVEDGDIGDEYRWCW